MKNDAHAIAVTLTNVSKRYVIHHEKPTFAEIFIKHRNETFWALQHIDLTVHTGERLGIIGHNGSGKTTLLKIIAGITSATSGTVKRNGKIVSLIDLEAGFHPDLTGIQNIYLNGMLLGLSREIIDARLNEIIAFADIGQFIDAPLFTYSSGMVLRLGFSVAAHSNPDILLIDENFSVGDESFRKKTTDKMQEFKRQKKTIILVSQWIDFIRKNSDRIITIEHGKILNDETNIPSKK